MAYSFDQKEIEYFLENNLCLSNGSVKNCINFKTGASDFVYNEITGYQLSILLMKKQRNLLNKKFDEQIASIVNYLKHLLFLYIFYELRENAISNQKY